jgi:hypothetical protein
VVTWGTAAILLVLAVLVVAVPNDVPGLVVPGSAEARDAMKSMHMNPAPMKPMHKQSTHKKSMQMH